MTWLTIQFIIGWIGSILSRPLTSIKFRLCMSPSMWWQLHERPGTHRGFRKIIKKGRENWGQTSQGLWMSVEKWFSVLGVRMNCHCGKIFNKWLKRKKGCFCLMGSEASVIASWLCCFWACEETEYHAGRALGSNTAHLMAARKWRAIEKKRGMFPKAPPQWSLLPPMRPTPLQFPMLLNSATSLWPRLQSKKLGRQSRPTLWQCVFYQQRPGMLWVWSHKRTWGDWSTAQWYSSCLACTFQRDGKRRRLAGIWLPLFIRRHPGSCCHQGWLHNVWAQRKRKRNGPCSKSRKRGH